MLAATCRPLMPTTKNVQSPREKKQLYRSGDIIVLERKNGFRGIGNATRECKKGKWTSATDFYCKSKRNHFFPYNSYIYGFLKLWSCLLDTGMNEDYISFLSSFLVFGYMIMAPNLIPSVFMYFLAHVDLDVRVRVSQPCRVSQRLGFGTVARRGSSKHVPSLDLNLRNTFLLYVPWDA